MGCESQKECKSLPFQPPASIWFSTETALTGKEDLYQVRQMQTVQLFLAGSIVKD